MRLATYNVEWFNSLFGKDGRLLLDGNWSARHNVTRRQQADALGAVFRAMDADAVLVVEAPDTDENRTTAECLLSFARAYDLRLDTVVTGFLSGTQQEIALFFDQAVMSARHAPAEKASAQVPRFDEEFAWDVDVDGEPDLHRFSKPPLELSVNLPGTAFHLIGVHVKSKAPHGAKSEDHAVRISIANRRKQLAQCLWIRRRVDEWLAEGKDVVVLGDFNDGPGLDEYEALFGRSGVEIVLGNGRPAGGLFDPHASARLNPRQSWSPSTARFYKRDQGTYLNALLDFVMLSDGLKCRADPVWKIWHPFDDGACFRNADLSRALLTASDHFPVSVDLNL